VTTIPKRPIGRIAGTLHLDSALIARKQNMQTQAGVGDALKLRPITAPDLFSARPPQR